MHPTAMQNGKLFFDTYLGSTLASDATVIVEIGAQDVKAPSGR